MRKTFLRAVGFAVITTIIVIGCGDNGVQDKTLDVGDLLNAITGGGTTPMTATYTLTVNIPLTEGGTVSRDIERSSYDAGMRVSVTATPNNGYEFVGWSGASNSKDLTVTVTMDANMTLYAGFQKIGMNLPKYTVYFSANGATGAWPEPIQRDSGSVVSLPNQAGLEKEWHTFAGWNTESNGNGKNYKAYDEYTVTNTVTLFAKWTRDTYTFTVYSARGGTISRTPYKALYAAGEKVTVTAKPNEHFTFTGWSGASSSKDSVITITMDGNKVLTPVFTQNTYTLTTNVSIDGGGSVSRSPNANTYNPGTEVTVTATPASKYMFTGWTGASNATTATVKITMNENKTLTAGFRDTTKPPPPRYIVTFNGNGATTGSVSAITADSGATITLPEQGSLEKNGYSFEGWSTNINGTVGTDYPVNSSYIVKNNVTLYAKWTINTYTLITIASPSDGGTFSCSPANQASYNHGTRVIVTATANSGYTFIGWSGDVSETETKNKVTTILMDKNNAVTANFEPIISTE